jgi:hypothetical protein
VEQDPVKPSGTESKESEGLVAKATLRRPFLPLRRSISVSLRTGFGRLIGRASTELISAVPGSLETLSSSLMKSPSPAEVQTISTPPPSPTDQQSLPRALSRKTLRNQRIKRLRSLRQQSLTSDSLRSPLSPLHLRGKSRRVLFPDKQPSPEEVLLEAQARTLREMHNRVAILTRSTSSSGRLAISPATGPWKSPNGNMKLCDRTI